MYRVVEKGGVVEDMGCCHWTRVRMNYTRPDMLVSRQQRQSASSYGGYRASSEDSEYEPN